MKIETFILIVPADTKHFEAQLKINQPELYSYCTQLANARQCVLAINSIRECKRQIQLAESLIANRYANFLSDKTSSGSTIETVTGSLMGQSSALVEICTQYQASLGNLTSPISLSTSADNRVTLVRPYHMRSNVGTGTGSVRDRSKPRKLCIVKADSSSGQQSSWRTSGNTVALQTTNNRRQGSNDVNFRYDDTNSSSDVVRIEIRDRDSCPSWLPALRDVKPGTTASLLPTLINVTGTKPSTRDSRKR